MMNWVDLWMKLFGTTVWLGLDIGFWVSMGVVTLLVVIMNVVFWALKPKSVGKAAADPVHELLRL